MLRFSCVALFALTLAAAHVAVTHGQPLEQKRPYQFGFTVDQQQHRFEKQDERGIVMGEFGFITADGIYHVTVYATDEEGKFRILAMKSYPYESPPKTIEMVVKPKQTPPATTASPPPKFNPNKIACSGCFIPEDTAKDTAEDAAEGAPPKSAKTPIRTLSQSLGPEEGPNARSPGSTGGGPSTVLQSIAQTALNNAVREAKRPSQRAGAPATTTHAHDSAPDSNTNSLTPSQLAVNSFNLDTNRFEGSSTPGRPAGGSSFNSPATPDGAAGTRTNNRGAPAGTEVAAEAETATGNARTPAAAPSGGTRQTPVRNAASGGSSGGLGSTASTDAGDLYRFKYLLDYNGHTETGARDGSKQGSFFAIGDDNVRRTIEYVANEFGFQPRISWRKLEGGVKLPLENALKDYEFVWFRRD